MALLAMPYGHMALWFQVTLHHLIIGLSQLTQLCLRVPPYVNHQAINMLKHGFSRAIRAYSGTRAHALQHVLQPTCSSCRIAGNIADIYFGEFCKILMHVKIFLEKFGVVV